MIQVLKKYRFCWIAPAAALALVFVLFGIYHLFPFAQRTLSWCDMNQQVLPILLDFKNILSGQSNLFLNMSNAGGMSFWGVFLFFASSPFSFLVVFVDPSQIYFFANILVALKIMTCAFTASLFLRSRFASLDVLQNVALSLLYAFCGYTMMYYQNVVWLDMMYLFPLLLWGLYRLIEKGKPPLYILSFTAVLAVNFYLSYMIVVFLVLAFGVYVFLCVEKEKRRRTMTMVSISTILVALITAVFWLPSLQQYLESARTVGIIQSLSSGSFFTQLSTTLPVILCTAALLCVIPMAFLTNRLRDHRVLSIGILFVLMLIPVVVEPINKMWHTGSYQAFPVRYGYMTVFLGLILLAVVLSHFNDEAQIRPPRRQNRILFIGTAVAVLSIAAVACVLVITKFYPLTSYIRTLWVSKEGFGYFCIFVVLALAGYVVLLLLYRKGLLARTCFSILLCGLVVTECLFSGSIFIGGASQPVKSYQSVLDLGHQIEDDSLFRVKNEKKYFDVNLVGAMGYNTLNHYTSLTSKDFMYTMKKLGFSSYWMEVNSNGGTSLSDLLMANKYNIIRNDDLGENPLFSYMNPGYTIAENSLVDSFGVVFSSDNIESLHDLAGSTRMEIQETLFQNLYGPAEALIQYYDTIREENVAHSVFTDHNLEVVKPQLDSTLLYGCNVEGTQTLYFDCFHTMSNNLVEAVNDSVNVYVNGELVETKYPSQKNNGLLKLGTFTDETVIVRVEVLKNVVARSFGVFGVKEDVLRMAASQKPQVRFQQEGNTLEGTTTATGDNQYLFLPLIAQKGYRVTVNGKEVEQHTVFDAFLAVKLENGINKIEVSFVPPGFFPGILLSVIGVGGAVLFLLLLYFRKDGFLHVLSIPATILFLLVFAVVFIGIYLFPLFVYIFFR